MSNVTKVACIAYIVRDNKLLLGKRLVPYGYGMWGMPGGHLEYMERSDAAVVREVAEEVGMKVATQDVELIAVADTISPEVGTH